MKAFKFFLAFALLIAPFATEVYSQDEGTVVQIKQKGEPGTDTQKTGNPIPFKCLLIDSDGVLVFHSSSISQNAGVELINVDTLAETDESIFISSVPSYVYVPAPGDYIINVTLENGNSYTGYFSL